MASFLSLPPELKDAIFEYFCLRLLRDRTLRLNGLAISLVCKDFLPSGRSILYGMVRISRDSWERQDRDHIADEKTLNQLHSISYTPGIGRHIQRLYIDLDVVYSMHTSPHLYNSDTSDYGTWEALGRDGATLNSSLQRLANLLRNCAHLKEFQLVSHSPRDLLDFLAALPRGSSLECLGWRERKPNAVYGRLLSFPDCWTFILAKLLRRQKQLRSFEITSARDYPWYDPKFREYERAIEFETFTSGGPALHSCAIPTLKMNSYFSDQYFRIFDASKLVHLTLGLSQCSLRVLTVKTFSNVTQLFLTGSDYLSFFKHGSKILPQFPTLETLEYKSNTIRGKGIDIKQSRSAHLGAILDSLPSTISSLELIDYRYPYESNALEVDAIWKSTRLEKLSSICMIRHFSLMPWLYEEEDMNEYLWIRGHSISDLLQGKSYHYIGLAIFKPVLTFACVEKYPNCPRRAQIHVKNDVWYDKVKQQMSEDRLRE